ncbi:hypothetical protein COCOBI_05-6450 [Coccomyxa sp. Obi]|nr:hypothetical protein COCOBI_05-6450 [Coccomyxa sp. Obi]
MRRKAVSHASEGPTPNLYWGSVTIEELRAHNLFTGLPEAPPSLEPAMYRYLRQDTSLWSTLHQGLLSGSSINAVLGFYEPLAAKRLGIPNGYVGHGKLLSACKNLQLPQYVPSHADLASLGCASPPPASQTEQPSSAALPAEDSGAIKASAATEAKAATEEAGGEKCRAGKGSNRKKRGKRKAVPVQPTGRALLGTESVIARSVRPRDFERELQLHRMSVCMRKAAEGIGAVRCKWGNTQEATALFELMHALPEGSLEEVGLCMADPAALESRYGFGIGRLPPIGASPDGLMRQRHASPAASALSALRGAFEGLSIRDCSRSAQELEVVEVKNACPYRQVTTVTRKGRAKISYVLADGGPHNRIARNWVAQLQLEMLATPANSALLVSRSATKGLTIYRMWRDEDYVQTMLHFVSRLYTEHVLPGRTPPANIFWGLPEYASFLERTVALADGAAVVAHITTAEVERAACADFRPFL